MKGNNLAQTVLCLASFKSLNEYDWSDLLEVTKGLEDVYKRQVLEPTEERRLKLEMKILNDITDGVSSKVRINMKATHTLDG